jgi:polysaccharide biosynthesis/export protein
LRSCSASSESPVVRGVIGGVRSALIYGALTLLLAGCDSSPWNDFINPGEPKIIDPDQKPLVFPILDTLASGVEGADAVFPDATDIEPADLVPEVADYKIGPEDVVDISVFDLMGAGTGEQVKEVHVTETGSVSLPFILPVKAEGLTERELENAVSKAYEDARLVHNARVSVSVQDARARRFTIQGNVTAPGEYPITRPDFRMLDALVVANGLHLTAGVEYAYVIRKTTEPAAAVEPSQPPNVNTPATPSSLQPSIPTSGPADLLSPPPPTGPQSRAVPDESSVRTMLMDNLPGADSSTPFKFDDVEKPTDQRIIRVPIDQLQHQGKLKYNIVIRPSDMIIVPDPVMGVYYIGGHVIRAGVFSLSGDDKVTLKKAWIAAGGPDNFSFPNRTEVVRRVGTNREVCARVDMSKVLAMQQPDIYLKPNDTIYVGTHFIAPWLAGVRTSFQFTYGADFLYDVNYAPVNSSSANGSDSLGTPPSAQ